MYLLPVCIITKHFCPLWNSVHADSLILLYKRPHSSVTVGPKWSSLPTGLGVHTCTWTTPPDVYCVEAIILEYLQYCVVNLLADLTHFVLAWMLLFGSMLPLATCTWMPVVQLAVTYICAMCWITHM
jgi:hypothetical protein